MNVPFYVVTASVPPGNRVTRFHGVESSSGSALLGDFPRFRHGSFDVAIPGWPQPGPEDSLELRWYDRKVLRLYQNGTLLFRARADADFLGWGVEPQVFHKFPKLDPLVVVEVNTSFVHRYRAVVERLKHPPDRVFFHLSLHDFTQNGLRLFLTKYFPKGQVDWSAVTRYVVQTTEESLEASASDLMRAPNRVAYQVVAAFMSMFDMPAKDIPFVSRLADGAEIDLDAIQAL